MATYTVRSKGKTFKIQASDTADPAEVKAWAKKMAPSWQDGGVYTYHGAEDSKNLVVERGGKYYSVPKPEGMSTTETYDAYMNEDIPAKGEFDTPDAAKEFGDTHAAVPGLVVPDTVKPRLRPKEAKRRVAELDAAIPELSKDYRANIPPVTPGTAGVMDQMASRMMPTDPAQQRRKQELDEARAERDSLDVGSAYELGGGVVGGVAGGALGTLGGPAASVTVPLGAVVGAAIGSGIGKLADVAKAQEVQEIPPGEALRMVKESMISSAVFDGATLLLLGPGGAVVGALSSRLPFVQALKRQGVRIRDWQKILDRERTRNLAARASQDAPPDLTTGVSDKLGIATPEGVARRRTTKLVEDMYDMSGGKLPTRGEMTGEVGKGERFLREYAPEQFAASDRALTKAAKAMRDNALRELDKAKAYNFDAGFGEGLTRVLESADQALKQNYLPKLRNAQQLGMSVDSTPAYAYLKEVMDKAARNNYSDFTSGEKELLQELLDFLGPQPNPYGLGGTGAPRKLAPEAALDLASNYKAKARKLAVDGKPSSYMEKVMHQFNEVLDKTFDAAARKVPGGAKVADELIAGRMAYREGMQDIYSDYMAKAMRMEPEKVGEMLAKKGNQTSVQELRAALKRAYEIAPESHSRMTLKGKTVYGKKDVAKERERIDAGILRGFLNANTSSMKDLAEQLDNEQFRRTLKELLTGMNQSPAGAARSQKVLRELDRMSAAVKLANPELAPSPGRLMPKGGPGSLAVARGVTGGGMGSGVAAAVAGVLQVGAVSRLIANAITTGNVGTINKVTRALLLSRNAARSTAAAEALRNLLEEIQADMKDTHD